MTEELNDFEQAKAAARNEWNGRPLSLQVQRMKELRDLKEEREAEMKMINAEYDVLRYETIPEKMDSDGIERISYEGIGRISLTGDLLVSTKAGAKDQLFTWFREHELADLVQDSINPSTLKAWVKGRMEKGLDIPTDLINITPITRAGITKG
jgi:hypothetical protein